MLSLLLSTLEMMALTFIIGFIVAGVIKLISVWADSLEFHHSEELSQFSKLNKLRAKIGEILGLDSVNEEEQTDDEREEFRQGVNSDLLHIKPSGYYHGVSHGASHLDLMDYYYPQDTRIMYLKKKEQMIRKSNTNKEENPSTDK
ncbi:hypothetical protein [Parabacteroides gordonii]|jgi:hypothetical protein|uniref:LapA family protein n=1 Tax=Parabacteroides gordonii MS-1 = DSM 23371 TaxID=1203610 RepID=A0A0F5IYX4_9BACT|nr:hypothetical protein [Parabacteroides gordonii]KKB50643.1 hypothetical protein HMPREF1536_04182 [Parabacteroides gordonii MS-1 = DSM 23371]MCA5585399.1 LapA family protein [Parabacteroides gordonii]RGP16413.1 LapA family protein [Parabacteroides gordonii]